MTKPEELLGALVLLPLPERLHTPPHLLMRPTSTHVMGETSGAIAGVVEPPVIPRTAPDDRRRRRRAALLVLAVLLVAGGGGSLAYVFSHGHAAGDAAATAATTSGGQPAANQQTATAPPLFGTQPPIDVQTPDATPTPTSQPTATPGPTLPPLAVTGISICFVDVRGNCSPGTTVQGCTPNGVVPGDVCTYELTFELAAGAGGTIDWSLGGTVFYCMPGSPTVPSKPFGPSTGSVSVSARPSPNTVTTAPQAFALDVNPASHTLSAANVTSSEGPGTTGTIGFYGTGNC